MSASSTAVDADITPELKDLLASVETSVRSVIKSIDKNQRGIVLLVDDDRRLVATITDGDIRRAMLKGIELEAPIRSILPSDTSARAHPVTAPMGTPSDKLLEVMRDRSVRHIPILDNEQRVASLVTLDELLPSKTLPVQAVLMAGGFGSRLQPLTSEIPKPMLQVGGKPVLELLIEQLQRTGIKDITVATHYLPEAIRNHFGDGDAFDVDIEYVHEEHPFGTGGALGLMQPPDRTVLVMNGDIVTQLAVRDMLAYHREHGAKMTVAVQHYEMQVPYGVVESDGECVKCVREKPQLSFFVNAGIYLMEPSVFDYMPRGKPFNMTDVIQWLIDANERVVSFPIREYWLDIGHHSDYSRAQNDVSSGQIAG